jgi:hypothetical protein
MITNCIDVAPLDPFSDRSVRGLRSRGGRLTAVAVDAPTFVLRGRLHFFSVEAARRRQRRAIALVRRR